MWAQLPLYRAILAIINGHNSLYYILYEYIHVQVNVDKLFVRSRNHHFFRRDDFHGQLCLLAVA